MSDRKPRGRAGRCCPTCGRMTESAWCSGPWSARHRATATDGPWEDLAAAIERVGEAAFFAAVQRYLRWCVVIREEPAVEGLVRALRGAGEKEAPDGE